ncbi:ATP-binding protein [Streptomyces sp. NPDC054849]
MTPPSGPEADAALLAAPVPAGPSRALWGDDPGFADADRAGQPGQPGQDVAGLLLSLLERRYLGDFDAASWTVGEPARSAPRPLLHQVEALGVPVPGEDWNAALPHVLNSCHSGGHVLSVAVHGTGTVHRVHWGGRRLPGVSAGSTEDFLHGQTGTLRAHVPGLRLGPAHQPDEGTHAELTAFLRTAPALAVVTGIPSPAFGPSPAAFQSLDRLTSAVDGRYALVVAAEPLPAAVLDATLDHCRRIRGEIHSMVRRTVNSGEGSTSSTSGSVPQEGDGEALPALLSRIAVFCALAAAVPPLAPATAILRPLGRVGPLSGPLGGLAKSVAVPHSPPSRTTGTSRSSGESSELLNAAAEACERLLQRHIDRLEAARSQGWWRTAVYLAAESDGVLESLSGALRGICSGESTTLDPLRVLRLPPALLREAALQGQVLSLTPADGSTGHPLGAAFDALATNITSTELAVLLALPRRAVPGLPMRESAEFALVAPEVAHRPVTLGRLLDSRGGEHQSVAISAEDLNRHVFITGMTGYGKTTTAKNLLLEAYTGLGVPFLVIEPAKAEYRHLAAHPGLRGRLRVFGIGPQAPMPLRLNPFEPPHGTPLSRHLDLLKAVFNASFPMFAGMSYVLEDAMIEVYTERGWDLQYSVNDLLGRRPSAADRAALIPSVGDLYGKIEEVLDRRSYGREVHQNMGAALRSRLGSLLVGTKGMALDTRRGVPVTELFERPAVVELRGLGDDEEKSFVMALLLCMLYEHAEARSDTAAAPSSVGLRHLTLIEEAHRLLRASRGPSGGEVADPQAKAVSMFTDMLAEMRAYGEGFVVADQVPVKLAPDVVKNSNVKILHRLVAADDRAVVSAAVNLTDRQSRHLGLLPPGVAVVHDERIGSAVLVAMREAEQVVAASGAQEPVTDDVRPGAPAEAGRHYLHRHGGCRRCPSPCTLLHRIDRPPARRSADAALAPFFQGLVFGHAQELWEAWSAWRAEAPADGGEAYCAFAQAAQRHLAALPRKVPFRAAATGRGAAPAAPAPSEPAVDEAGRHLLARDRAARVLAQLCEDWLAVTELTDRAVARLEQARAEFVALVASRPDRELPGCADCPSRCRPYALLADSLPAYAAQVAAAADRPVPLESRLLLIDRLADEYAPAARGAMEKDRTALLYCMTVTAHAYDRGLTAPLPAETLNALRADGPVVP